MSIAVAVRKSGRIVLASDSQTNLGSERVPAANNAGPKYVGVGDAYLAATGWTLYANIFADVLARRRSLPRLDGEERIFTFFNELWRRLHEDYSFVKDQADDADSPFGSLDSSFLVVSPAGLFSVSSDLSVMRCERYFAIGSGAAVAIGAVHALYDREADAEAIARGAVDAAMEHDVYCGPPVHVAVVEERRPPLAGRRKGAGSRGGTRA